MARTTPEETAEQHAHLAATRDALASALAALSAEAKTASRSAKSSRGGVDLSRVYAAVNDVERAEEGVDLATLDLQSASGLDV